MNIEPNDTHTGIALFSAGFIIVLARWLGGEKMTFAQYAGRSIINGLFALAAFSVNILYPEADNFSVFGLGVMIVMIGPTTTELLIQKVVKK